MILKLINLGLFLVAVLLLLNLFVPLSTISGNFLYSLDKTEFKCLFNNTFEISEIPIDRCCYEIQRELYCKKNGNDIQCYTTENTPNYIVNQKTISYCKMEGYDVETE